MADNIPNDGKIRFDDLIDINPQDVAKLEKMLQDVDKLVVNLGNNVKVTATGISKRIKELSNASKTGVDGLEDESEAVLRLKAAYEDLMKARTEEGRLLAYLKDLIKETNKQSVTAGRVTYEQKDSIKVLEAQLAILIDRYKNLSEAERTDANAGGMLLGTIRQLNTTVQSLANSMKPYIDMQEKMRLADERLAAANSEENKELKKKEIQIRNANKAAELAAKTELENAEVSETTLRNLKMEIEALEKLKRQYDNLSEKGKNNEKGRQLFGRIQAKEGVVAGLTRQAEQERNRSREVAALQQLQEESNKLATEETKLTYAASADLAVRRERLKVMREEDRDYAKSMLEREKSINQLKRELKNLVDAYNKLSEADRLGPVGEETRGDILAKQGQLSTAQSELDMLRKLQTEKQKYADLTSETGQQYLEERRKVQELTKAYWETVSSQEALVREEQKLAQLRDKNDVDNDKRLKEQNRDLKALQQEKRELNHLAKLEAQMANNAEGSYNYLSAAYERNRIILNKMKLDLGNLTEEQEAMVKSTLEMREQMVRLQEATGNYSLNVGHYQNVWDGLSFSITQVVREVPNAFISMQTFFLAISNNIPMVADEIAKLRRENARAMAEGRQGVNINKQIIKSLFSWNSALVLVVTALTFFGDKLLEWVKKLFQSQTALAKMNRAMANVAEEMKKSNGNLGDTLALLKLLSEEYKKLSSLQERLEWVKKNTEEFDKLGLAVNSVNDADNLFVKNTQLVVSAFKARAKAEAAKSLVSDAYEQKLSLEAERRQEAMEKWEKEISKRYTELTEVSGLGSGVSHMLVLTEEGAKQMLEYKQSEEGKREFAAYYQNLLDKKWNRTRRAFQELDDNINAYQAIMEASDKEFNDLLKQSGVAEKTKKGGKGRQPKDLTDIIMRNQIELRKKYEESVTALTKDEYAKRRKALYDETVYENEKLLERKRKNEEYVRNVSGKYKELTAEQRVLIEQQNAWIDATVENNNRLYEQQKDIIDREQEITNLQFKRANINAYRQGGIRDGKVDAGGFTLDEVQMRASLASELALLEENIKAEYQMQLDANEKLIAVNSDEAREAVAIERERDNKLLEARADFYGRLLDMESRRIERQLRTVTKGTEQELSFRMAQTEIEMNKALAEDLKKAPERQEGEQAIRDRYHQEMLLLEGEYQQQWLKQQQEFATAQMTAQKASEYQLEKLSLEQEKERYEQMIELARRKMIEFKDGDIELWEEYIKDIENKLRDLNRLTFDNLLGRLGFSNEAQSALKDVFKETMNNIKELLAAYTELAEKEVAIATERAEASKEAYEAEIEARNNGYAHSAATAKKEYELQKANQKKKEKLLAEAKKRQATFDSITQASSLLTASSQIWKSLSGVPVIGPGLAIAAIGAMWTSFAAAKVKARQVAGIQEYGEGGLEFLDGGSHASGNDIDLGVHNSRGRRMRAEGGEAMAIISKSKTRRYKKVLPDIVDSLNKGTFEEKYLNAFAGSEGIRIALNAKSNTDLTKIEDGVQSIRKQNETRYYTMPNGTLVIQHKNVKRTIRN